jgi:hypothetical protein
MMYGIGDVAGNGDNWRRLGWLATTSPLVIIFDHPQLYITKVAHYFLVSFYDFAQALQPLLTAMLAIGIWARGRKLFGTPQESFLAGVVLFYFCGFALSYTGTRFMVHLVPFVFGWTAAGIILISERSAQWSGPNRPRLIGALVPAVLIVTLLPRTLWPIGYDLRGVRYAGEYIAETAKGPVTVAAQDGRVAFYAGARLVELPVLPPDSICGWLRSHDGDFLMIGSHDELPFKVTPTPPCLKLLKRYPRYRSSYYDLYAVSTVPRLPLSAAEREAQR